MKNLISKIVIGSALTVMSNSVVADSSFQDNIKKYNWNGIEVVYLENDKLPIFNMNVHFSDGSLSDKNTPGLTESAFGAMSSGTSKMSSDEIAEKLEFLASSMGANVTHESVSFSAGGMIQNMEETMKLVCHVLTDATYPESEINKLRDRDIRVRKASVNNHSSIASRVFREVSLSGTPFSYPTDGKISDMDKIDSKKLKEKLNYFNNDVNKRIYISGPKSALGMEKILKEDCGWSGKAKFVRSTPDFKKNKTKNAQIYIIDIPNANQAQVRMGRALLKEELGNDELTRLTSAYLGGGFTSKLMKELRVKRGLTYSVSAYAGRQKDYGRSIVSTFTKKNTVGDLLRVTKGTLDGVTKGEVSDQEFKNAQGLMAGSYPFKLETDSSFLGSLMNFDHLGKPYSEFFKFPETVKSYKKEDMIKKAKELYNWDDQVIVILGPAKEIKPQLKGLGDVMILDYKQFI